MWRGWGNGVVGAASNPPGVGKGGSASGAVRKGKRWGWQEHGKDLAMGERYGNDSSTARSLNFQKTCQNRPGRGKMAAGGLIVAGV